MNCKALRQSIDELKNTLEQLRDVSREANRTGVGKEALNSAMDECDKKRSEILEQYLDDFSEKNPDVNIKKLSIGNSFTTNVIFQPDNVPAASIKLIPMKDGRVAATHNDVLSTGSNISIFDFNNQQFENLHFEPEKIEVITNAAEYDSGARGAFKVDHPKEYPDSFPDNLKENVFCSISNDEVVVGTDDGEVMMYHHDEWGEWQENGSSILSYRQTPKPVDGITLLANGAVLAWNKYGGYMAVFEKVGDGWKKTQNLPMTKDEPNKAFSLRGIADVAALPNGNACACANLVVFNGVYTEPQTGFIEIDYSNSVERLITNQDKIITNWELEK